jgi:hypothetical protein
MIDPQYIALSAVVILWTFVVYVVGHSDGRRDYSDKVSALTHRNSILKAELADALDRLARAERKRSHLKAVR